MFLPAYAQDYTFESDNQTIQITINPEINVTPQNLSKIEEALTNLSEKPSWTQGDILIASSSIFAFFTFGSVLALARFSKESENETENETEQIAGMKIILLMIAGIQIIHIYAIISIVIGTFSEDTYVMILVMTILLILVILYSISKILDLEPNVKEKNEFRSLGLPPLIKMLDDEMLKRRKAEEDLNDTRRKLKNKENLEGD